jgi:hypothetical protein
MSAMAEPKTTSEKTAVAHEDEKSASDVVFSMPLRVATKRDAGTGDERKFSVEFTAGNADGVHTMFVNGTVDGDTADRLELASDYVLEVRRA